MSFTRSRYSAPDYQRDLDVSVGPGNYSINLPRNSCNDCFSPNVRNTTSHAYKAPAQQLVDVDSELMGLNYPQTKCPQRKFLPSNEEFVSVAQSDDCPIFTGESTRLSNPPCTLRGTGISRWEWLCQDLQADHSIEPFLRVIDTRLLSKDSHRSCIPTPQMEQGSLPQPQAVMEGYSNFGGLLGNGEMPLDQDPEVVMFYNQDHSNYGTDHMLWNTDNQTHWQRCSRVRN